MKTNYYQVVDMTKEEKIAMYMKCTKWGLIEMLLENQDLLMQSIMRNYNFTDKSSWPPPYNEAINTVTKFTATNAKGAGWVKKNRTTTGTPSGLRLTGRDIG